MIIDRDGYNLLDRIAFFRSIAVKQRPDVIRKMNETIEWLENHGYHVPEKFEYKNPK